MNIRHFAALYALISLLLVSSYFAQAQDHAQKLNTQEVKLLIDSLSNALNRWYVYPDKATLMISRIEKNYKTGAYNNTKDRAALSTQILKDLQLAYKDAHLEVVYDPQLSGDLETPRNDTASNRRAYEEELNTARENNFAFKKIEILPGNIGYLRWDGFWEFVEEAKPTLNAAFQFVSNCQALIIDMRNNGGGAPPMVLQTQSYFFDQKTRMNDIIDRNNDTEKRWTDPATTPFKLDMPVYILTSHQTFSGAEDFTYGLKCVKRAIVVGDTTGGGAHPTRPFSIGQGFVVFIPTHRSPNIVTQTDWDGTGVYPDVAIPSAQALTKAQALIFAAFLSNASDEREKRMFQGNLNCMNNKLRFATQIRQDNIQIPAETLLKYCGAYDPADPNTPVTPTYIINNGNHLFRHVNNSVEDVRLIPVAANTFIYDDDSGRTIVFTMNKNEEVADMILSNKDGVFKLNKKK